MVVVIIAVADCASVSPYHFPEFLFLWDFIKGCRLVFGILRTLLEAVIL